MLSFFITNKVFKLVMAFDCPKWTTEGANQKQKTVRSIATAPDFPLLFGILSDMPMT